MRAMAIALALIGLTACGGGPENQVRLDPLPDVSECRPETYAVLHEFGIPRADVRSFFNVPRRVGMRRPNDDTNDRILGHSNWLRLRSCEGSLVLVFNRACQFRYAFARGDCTLPGEV